LSDGENVHEATTRARHSPRLVKSRGVKVAVEGVDIHGRDE
jgi:hypothetical protein